MSNAENPQLPVTFGTPIQQVAVGGFHVTEARYAAGIQVPAHEHAHASWTLVLSGDFEETFGDETIRCTAGSLLAKPASATHTNRYGPRGARALVVEIKDVPAAFGRTDDSLIARVTSIKPASAGRLVRRVRAEFSTEDRGRELAIHALLFEIATLLVRTRDRTKKVPRERWLDAARDRLCSEFFSPPSLEALARDAGVHPVYLCQTFRAKFGCSPGAYVRRVRLEIARIALERTDDPISQIAFSAGFSDQSHMNRRFRAAFGVTPASYRRGARGS